MGLANPAIRRHRPVLRSKQLLPRFDVRQVHVDSLDRGLLVLELLLEQPDPRPPRGLARSLADVASLILVPGTGQHTVRPPPVRRHPGPGGVAGPRLTSDSTQHGGHRLFPQHSSLEVVGIDRGHQQPGARCPGHRGKPGHHGHVPVNEVPLRRYPRVQNPRRLQGCF
jgi:hypothetical protein